MSAGSGASNLGYGNINPYNSSPYVNGASSNYSGSFSSNEIPGLPGLAGSKSNIDAAAGVVPGICNFKGGAKKLKRKNKAEEEITPATRKLLQDEEAEIAKIRKRRKIDDDEKNKLIGVNRVECSKMNMKFKENQVNRISFLGRPDAKLVPPAELTNDGNRLDGFEWREKEKPTKEEILGVKFAPKKIDVKPVLEAKK